MSTITYQFGGKDGLYLACARLIARTIGGFVASIALEGEVVDAQQARDELAKILRIMTAAMLRRETAAFARFMMREQQEPSAAFDIIYDGIMGRLVERIVSLLRVVGGDGLTDAEARVRAVTLLGQVLAFRVARAAALRLNRWEDIGKAEHAMIDAAVQANLAAILNDIEAKGRA